MYYLFVLGRLLTSLLPRQVCYAIAKTIALFNHCRFIKGRKIVDYNLAAIIPDPKERKREVKNVFINFSYYLTDFFRHPKINEAFLKRYVKVSGLENLDSALSQHKGAVILTAHLGNYELAGAIISLLGYSVSVVALPHKDKRVNNFFDSRRKMAGLEVIPTGAAVRGCFSALKTGRMIALLGDKDFAGGGIKTKMFSRYAYLPRGPAFFALKTKAPIVPVFLVRVDKYCYRFIFEKPICLDKDSEYDERSIIANYLPVLEKYLRQYAGQWYMFGKYWVEE